MKQIIIKIGLALAAVCFSLTIYSKMYLEVTSLKTLWIGLICFIPAYVFVFERSLKESNPLWKIMMITMPLIAPYAYVITKRI